MKKNSVGIGNAAKVCGVTERQLRNWEDSGYIHPERVICGDRSYRQYNKAQLKLITLISNYLRDGFTLKHAAQKAKQQLEERTDG